MTASSMQNSFGALRSFDTPFGSVDCFFLSALEKNGFGSIAHMPVTIKILLEAVVRAEDGLAVRGEDVEKLAQYDPKAPATAEIPFKPARVLMQDFTGVPAAVDLAALRSAMADMGKDPQRINPILPVDLVIDHSVQVDQYGSAEALGHNAQLEFSRNRERYEFLHWAQKSFANFSVVPPASGICHQVNLEYLGKVVMRRRIAGREMAFPDTLVGTDSHTTMINGLGILGWGVGGIEAEAAMLGQPIYMLMPRVVGFRLTGALLPQATATDAVLTVTKILREKGVVGKFVEFFGPGLARLTLPDRATISNMAPEYGATCGFFPVDDETLRYLRYTGRTEAEVDLVERYCKEQGLFVSQNTPNPTYNEIIELDLAEVEPCLAGPKRPQDRIALADMKPSWEANLSAPVDRGGFAQKSEAIARTARVVYPDGSPGTLRHGDVVIAAITSCTNTSNPWVLIGAGLLAKKAVEAGLFVKPHVKTSLAPGSKVVTHYLDACGLTPYLDKLGFHTVGYGCTTCIGNSGPLPDHLVRAVKNGKLVVASVLSGNRNFEGRINPHTQANFLASPLLVVAYALSGNMNFDPNHDPIGTDPDGTAIFLRDLWPTDEEIRDLVDKAADPEAFQNVYATLVTDNPVWNAIPSTGEAVYNWNPESTYIQRPPFFEAMTKRAKPIQPIVDARVLVLVGNSVTTDHISPAGAIAQDSPAGSYLVDQGVTSDQFNSYGSRRGNDRVMTRGTFANIRLRNLLAPGTEGGWTTNLLTGEVTSIYEASLSYKKKSIPAIVLAGKDYGMGSSRDWAAKGTFLLGVRAVLAESFERIHRSNLVGMGVLPLQFLPDRNVKSLGLTGQEVYTIEIDDDLAPGQKITVRVAGKDGDEMTFSVLCRIDTPIEVEYYRNGGILHTVLRKFADLAD